LSPLDHAVRTLSALGIHDPAEVTELTGGVANTVCLVRRPGHDDVVLKSTEGVPGGIYRAEAESLDVLRDLGGLRTPHVLSAGPSWLLLEALVPTPPPEPAFWERAGRAVAALHDVRGERFGWQHDGWLGLLPQHNRWDEDGHRFFAEQRVLRYVGEPRAEAVLTAADRAALERLCTRLPELVPSAPPALTHGDLWHNNVAATADGEPAFLDPAVSWTWPEVDLSMMYRTGHAPARFFDAYTEVRPLADGWRERMPVLHVRQLLCILAQHGDQWNALDDLRAVLRPFRTNRPEVRKG
jgi:fructosamine-3-kinase